MELLPSALARIETFRDLYVLLLLQEPYPSTLQQCLLYARFLHLLRTSQSYYQWSICKYHRPKFGNMTISSMQLSILMLVCTLAC